MQLQLEIVSAQAGAMGANRRKVVGAAGMRIGREADGNDWVLKSDYVSRHHAIIRCVHGMFYVEARSNALTAVNDRARPLAKDEVQPLRDGDMLFIDEFEIQVRQVGADVQPAAPATSGNPLDDLLAPTQDSGRRAPADLLGAAAPPDDVLDLLGGAPPPRAPAPSPYEKPTFAQPSRLDDLLGQNFEPPPVRQAAAPAPQSGGLEDDWFKTSLPRMPAAAPRPVRPQPAPARSMPAAPPPLAPMMPPPPPPPSPQIAVTAAPAGTASADLANQILAAAGLDPAQHALRPELLRQFGNVLRTVVDGTMEVLRARAEIKDAFRLPETRIARSHNNPLKFSVDGADALFNLLVKRNDAYLDTEAAFVDAFEDIRFHQLAMLKGMQAGFENMLKHFDPAEQQRLAERATGSGGLAALAGLGGRKGRQWDEYAAAYQALVQDRDDAFRRLFGDAFGRAYEEELRRLKTVARAQRRGGTGE